MRLARDEERRPPVLVPVFGELEIPPGAVHAFRDLPDAAPVIQPAMRER